MVKNELGRFLRPAFDIWDSFADTIVALDDSSTDGTREFLEDTRAHVFDASLEASAWGDETPARRKLFDIAWDHTTIDDYILFLDADMIPARDPHFLTESGADAVFFGLYDLWEPRRFRSDSYWRGHIYPRVWMIRRTDRLSIAFHWQNQGMHVGHIPTTMTFESFLYAPKDASLLHYAYVDEALREEKYVAYASVSEHLTDFERAHACTILDPNPNLEVLPFEPEFRLL